MTSEVLYKCYGKVLTFSKCFRLSCSSDALSELNFEEFTKPVRYCKSSPVALKRHKLTQEKLLNLRR